MSIAVHSQVYIYGLYDPRDGLLRYVGKTKSLNSRLSKHRHHASCGKFPCHKTHWINSLSQMGMKPEMRVLEETDHNDWQDAERFWISTSRLAGFNLTNIGEGGEGGLAVSQETRKKLSLLNIGKKHSLESRKKMSESRKRENLSPETLLKMSLRKKGRPTGRKGVPLSDAHRQKLSEAWKTRAPMSEATKLKIKLKAMTPERRKAVSDRFKGNNYWTGKTFSLEYRKKLSEAHKKRIKNG